ncbi:MAG: MBL fold metallo-hydrolase [Oscillospiraceae bacterium]|jgi:glyoxylase-like metal-dependent hydrolase (beta-lactamase superfamily II)|nr:MBL fold metallo-hydrolase [Oscillospiraceae bacterium]
MKLYTLVLGDYQVNCYLVSDEVGRAVIIDPGYEPERILRAVKERNLEVKAIFLTHGHFDHIGAVKPLVQALQCPVYVHPKEATLPPYLTQGLLWFNEEYAEGDVVSVGDLSFRVIETPGHTNGSVCLLCEDHLFSGDTLFAGSCGRTDLGGSMLDMLASLKKLAALEGNYRVHCGHGPETDLDTERRENPYIHQRSFR